MKDILKDTILAGTAAIVGFTNTGEVGRAANTQGSLRNPDNSHSRLVDANRQGEIQISLPPGQHLRGSYLPLHQETDPVRAGALLLDSRSAQAQITRPERTPEIEQVSGENVNWLSPFPLNIPKLKPEYAEVTNEEARGLIINDRVKDQASFNRSFRAIKQFGDNETRELLVEFLQDNKYHELPSSQDITTLPPEYMGIDQFHSLYVTPVEFADKPFSYLIEIVTEKVDENDNRKIPRIVHTVTVFSEVLRKPEFTPGGTRFISETIEIMAAYKEGKDQIRNLLASGKSIEEPKQVARQVNVEALRFGIAVAKQKIPVYKGKPGITDTLIASDSLQEGPSASEPTQEPASIAQETE